MELKIYNQNGELKLTASTSSSSTWNTELMTENAVSASFTHPFYVPLDVNDYVLLSGIKFSINKEYKPKQKSTQEYSYSVKFYGPEHDAERVMYLHLTDGEYEPQFSLNASPALHLQKWVDNMNRIYGEERWSIGETVDLPKKNIEYNNVTCFEALFLMSDVFETEWWADGFKMNLTRCERGDRVELGYMQGLTSLTQSENSDDVKFFTRLIPLGSTKNIDRSRYGFSRLQLPDRAKYVDRNMQYGLYEHIEEAAFTGIFPQYTGTVSTVRSEEKTDNEGRKFTVYYFNDADMMFDPNKSEIAGLTKRLSFQTGDLAGQGNSDNNDYWFEANYNSTTLEWEIINTYPSDDVQIPGGNLIPRPGDKYIPWNFRMPESYEVQAERDYEDAVNSFLEKYSEDASKYGGDTDYIYIDKNSVPLVLGQNVRLLSDEYFGEIGYRDSRMTKVVRKLDNLSVATIECSNQVGKGWKTQVDSSINELKYVIGQKEETVLDILKSWDGREINDYRVLSGLRTLKEIKQRALSRLNDDEAAGHIKLRKGGTVENGLIVRLPKQNTPAALMSCLLEEDIDTFVEEDEDAIVEVAPAEASGDLTLGGLINVDPSFDTLPNDVYSLEMCDGTLYPKQGGGLVIGDTAGTAYDGGAGAALEQLVRELAGGAGTMYSVYIRNNMPSLGFAAQYGEECVLDFTFVSQYRDDISEPYKPTGELGLCTIMVKNSKYVDFTVVKQMEISSNVSIKQDVAEWLTSGSNNIKITIKGENTDQTTAPVTYTVQLTSLGVSAPNFAWWTAFAGDIAIPMIVNGNISKTLHITVTGEDYNQNYTQNLGTAVYLDTPYIYTLPHPGTTGVYNVSFYLSNSDNTIQTKAVSINIMCISAGETIKLMCVNNVAEQLTNWQDNTVFDYAIYDGASALTDALFSIMKGGSEVYSSENDSITTNAKQTLTYPMEVDTDDDANFDVIVSVTSDNNSLIDPITLNVNNSLGYSATAGAALYINPRTRSNSQSNSRSIVNEVDKSVIPVTWNNFNWGNDGWVSDDDGVKALKIFARSSAVIDYQPFAVEAARRGKTIEVDFKVENASDASKNIITIAEGNVGLKVSGENISFFSQSRHDSTTQDVPTDNGVRMRLTVVVMPDAYGNAGFNIVAIYINGKKNRQYAYESNDYFRNSGKIVLGNDYANLYLYGLRVYDSALTSEAVQKNYINQLVTTDEKQTEKSINQVLDGEGVNIDFNATKMLYNVFVVDKPFPNLNNPSGVAGNLEVFFKDKPERNFTLTNLLVEGQGTSSKKYLEWNIRFKMKGLKDAEGNKINSIATYADGTTDKNKVLMFDGVPKSGRLTAKKNWASSMQDHKAGSVAAYNDLYKEIGMKNEAMIADPQIRVAVYQEPFIGFSKSVNEEGQDVYTCMGEFTFGPDKGDDLCFGYDTEAFPALLSVEGSDNAPLGALFRVPWNTQKSYWAYNADEEAFQYNNTNCWDFDAGELNADETEPLSAQKWIDAYNAVYVCNNRIRPFKGTLAELNNAITEYRSTGYEYWIAKSGDANLYNLYYYEAAEGKFIPSDIGNGQINLKTQLTAYLASDLSAFTADQLNELFINSRKQLFRATVPEYFDIDDAVFHYNFVEFTAGTDQRAKNTYPYSFCTTGSKWRWRLDDADTIFPIDNQGQDRKPYWCEMHDYYDNGQPIWNGETSVFWNLLEQAFSAEITAGMRKMFAAMESLCGQSSGTPYDKAYAFYKKYFLGIKEYFPATLVNADAKRYELAKIAYDNDSYSNDTDPITQSHGDFYSAETAWIKKRIMYIMSKYNYGLFSANGTDTIIVRAAGDLIDYDITPAFDMYPAIANGTSIVQGTRTKAGETCRITIDLGGSADQQNAIQAASWLLSIGDWHKKNVSGTMVVCGKRLSELILGSKTDDVIISITGLTLADCGSMQKVLLSNIATLQGTLDLSTIINIREVYADGTNLSQIKLPNGGGLEVIEYPANNKYITFRNFPMLTTEGLRIGQCAVNITDFLIENCPLLKPVQLLSDIIEAQQSQGTNHVLKHIRAVGFEEEYYSADALNMLANLADGTYEGLSAEGLAGEEAIPVLDGKVIVHSNYYQDFVDSLRNTFDRLELILEGEPAIYIADKYARTFIVSVFDTDNDGYVTAEEAAIERQLYWDRYSDANKVQIADLRELNAIEGSPSQLTNIKEYYMGYRNTETGNQMFYLNTSIEILGIGTNVVKVSQRTCRGCTNLKKVILNDKVEILYGDPFRDCVALTEISDIPDTCYEIGGDCFNGCSSLKSIVIGRGITQISYSAFRNCTSMESLFIKTAIPPMLGNDAFTNNHCKIYVSIGSGAAYKAATNWSAYADRIYEYDF
ncbi:leucine-rich repeat domain-containing protein [Bacteroides sp.]|uniref:leucine-rich repeat domain-containing protein n=1 Tax=Bacteroides sp. TaxID=29523 RepID=UPI0025B92E3C|nr:leucine-rich repeat domain-containing protein [Bacteroides sp.]